MISSLLATDISYYVLCYVKCQISRTPPLTTFITDRCRAASFQIPNSDYVLVSVFWDIFSIASLGIAQGHAFKTYLDLPLNDELPDNAI